MNRIELAACCGLAALAALSTSAAAAPKKPKHGAAPAASASATPAPAASSAAPAQTLPPPPAPSAATAPATVTDEDAAHAAASPEGDKKFSLGADLLFVLPVGDFANATGLQVGPLIRAGYRFMPQLEGTARIGYLFAFNTSQPIGNGYNGNLHVADLPIWLGARYFFMDWPAGPYAAAELGMNFLMANASATIAGMNVSQSNTDTRVGFNLGAGYVWSKELPIDVRLQLSYFNLAGPEKALLGIGLSAGYSFFLF